MADPERRLVHMLAHAGRQDLIGFDKDEALFQHLTTLLNPHTPLKLHDCRKRWVRALRARYDTTQPSLDIICFTFALRHFNLELIEILNENVSLKVLSLIQKAVAVIIQTPSVAQDGSSLLKVFPWGDVAQFVSQKDWKLSREYLSEVLQDWDSRSEFYKSYGIEQAHPGKIPDKPDKSSNQVSLPSFLELMADLEHERVGGAEGSTSRGA